MIFINYIKTKGHPSQIIKASITKTLNDRANHVIRCRRQKGGLETRKGKCNSTEPQACGASSWFGCRHQGWSWNWEGEMQSGL
jgi:hypothetical protein